ncbi:MAG: dipeptide epimerase [Bacteroidia bacterium]|nr:dipeptide epimerase [Bacteroidia bacterium]
MKLSYKTYSLKFKHPFGVSGNTRTETPTVFVRLEENGVYGYGEACLPAYLGESTEATLAFLEKAKSLLEEFDCRQLVDAFLFKVDAIAPGHNAAKAAIDITLNDLCAKLAGKSFCEWKGIEQGTEMPTSFTIGIDSEEKIIQKLKESEGFEVLKIKAGTADDKKLISLIRNITDKPLYVDVNQGWRDKEYVVKMTDWMSTQNVILLEQPMPKEMKEDMRWVTERSAILTVADESVKRLSDLEQLEGAFKGINIKLMKCTGLNEAIKMIDYCKKHNLKILLGCMAESSCGTTAMAQLMAYADYVDLDAPQLYLNDPFKGVQYQNGKISVQKSLGIGAEPNQELSF